nr:zinc ribbon domain-containing protein [Candidatus Prometheoarchaeum syntrophicum]
MVMLSNSLNFEPVYLNSPPLKSASGDYDFSKTDLTLDPLSYYYVGMNLDASAKIKIHFETATENQGVKFFICDQENLDLWIGGNSASVYNLKEDMHSVWDSFIAPSTEKWYILIYNDGIFSSVKVDLYIDDGDNIPYMLITDHTTAENYQLLESSEFLAISFDSLLKGTSITVEFETYFSTDGIDFFICSAEELANFRNDNTFASFEYKFNLHTGSINSFKVPKKGDWVVVFYARDQADTISFCYSIDLEDPTIFEQFWYIFVILGVVAVGGGTTIVVAIVYNKRKKMDGKPVVSGTLTDIPKDSTIAHESPEDTQIVGEPQKFLFCVKCGHKNADSDRFCKNCGREINESLD